MDLVRKAFPGQVKAAEDGSFTAVFSTFDVVDHDGDVTRPGAFKDGAQVIVGSWGHKIQDLPVGKGVIRTDQREARVEGHFFLDTAAGKDTYQTVKNLGALGEWSYVFGIKRWAYGEFEGRQVRFLEDLEVFSVDPVLVGAGIDTRTTAIKGMSGLTFEEHGEEIADEIASYLARVKARVSVREKEGRTLSQANVDRLTSIAESLEESGKDLREVLEGAKPKGDRAVAREFLRFQQFRSALQGA
jgi:hypothetical protein